MRNIELHTLDNEADAASAENLGLITFGEIEICENCGERVAHTPNGFIECVVVLDDEDEWLLCVDCASPVTDPGIF
jgi:hypothetical protein